MNRNVVAFVVLALAGSVVTTSAEAAPKGARKTTPKKAAAKVDKRRVHTVTRQGTIRIIPNTPVTESTTTTPTPTSTSTATSTSTSTATSTPTARATPSTSTATPAVDEAAATSSPSASTPASPLRTAGYVGLAVSGATLAAGTVLAVMAAHDRETLSVRCPQDRCTAGDRETFDRGQERAQAATIVFGAGAALALASVGAIVFAPKPTEKAGVELHVAGAGLSLRGRFQ